MVWRGALQTEMRLLLREYGIRQFFVAHDNIWLTFHIAGHVAAIWVCSSQEDNDISYWYLMRLPIPLIKSSLIRFGQAVDPVSIRFIWPCSVSVGTRCRLQPFKIRLNLVLKMCGRHMNYHIHSNRRPCPNKPFFIIKLLAHKNRWNRWFLYKKCMDLRSGLESIIIHPLNILLNLSGLQLEWIRYYCKNSCSWKIQVLSHKVAFS